MDKNLDKMTSASRDPSSSSESGETNGGSTTADTRSGKPGFFKILKGRIRYYWARAKIPVILLVLFFVYLTLAFYPRIFVSIHSGQAGVRWERFGGGTDLEHIYAEGFHIIWPWDIMYIYNVRLQQEPFTFQALSEDGLAIDFEVSVRYRPRYARLPVLHVDVGPDYLNKVIIPEIQAEVREIVGQFTPEEIYKSEGLILKTIVQGAVGEVADRNIVLDDLLIKSIRLPEIVRVSIENKLKQQEIAKEYEYRIKREQREAERRGIEAEGIRVFQETVASAGSFDKFLRYRGIEATLQLATSQNAKVVIVGGGSDGLPLILNLPDDPPANVPVPSVLKEPKGEKQTSNLPEIERFDSTINIPPPQDNEVSPPALVRVDRPTAAVE